jgi:hypothetical protein
MKNRKKTNEKLEKWQKNGKTIKNVRYIKKNLEKIYKTRIMSSY